MARVKSTEQDDTGNFNAGLFNALPDPVILLNISREVVFANRAAVDMLAAKYEGRDLALSFRVPDVLAAAEAVVQGATEREVDVSLQVPVPKNLKIRIMRIEGSASELGAVALMVFHDVSSETMAEQMRQDFVANVSHELRSPIASLIGFIETLQGPAKEDAEARDRFLGIMGDEAQRMARMIDDLLSLSRVEASERMRPQEQVNIAELLSMTRELLLSRAKENAMELVFDIAPDLPVIAGDRDELMEVFQNLMDNAIKYGQDETFVKISAVQVDRIPEIGGAGIAVAVENEGEGIAPDQLPRLTERFYRVDKGRSREMGGTGLGLAIVKHIISRHRGRFNIESTVGKGATFTVYLPL
ncbi:MAG: PAS domain-containing protein [Rhodospirillaceae bacterium]|nr:PAS domain-containing protein [Rhodospirillaceae bacterium]MBT4587884.1 PAS domain-containing protein [Rhodospirillaceae bacterium]MBT5940779.1 PAS domain-containing protein [Rhodospirillaceae bacterium]MBT7266623.1 PAS domain-containing protein [Rhodospirillaceae bacterium]